MSLIRWTNQYEVGHTQIDSEHRDLFDCVNRFYEAWCERQDRREVSRLLSLLIEYAERHFRNEEVLMEKLGYPGLSDHRGKHEHLVEAVFELATRLENRSFNPSHETTAFLKAWLTEHILHDDMLFKAFLAEHHSEDVAVALA